MMTPDDNELRDALAALRAESDMQREKLGEAASQAARFFNGLVENGLTRDEAMALTQTWLNNLMNRAGGEEAIMGLLQMIMASGEEDDDAASG